jgi:hypothetical protein
MGFVAQRSGANLFAGWRGCNRALLARRLLDQIVNMHQPRPYKDRGADLPVRRGRRAVATAPKGCRHEVRLRGLELIALGRGR